MKTFAYLVLRPEHDYQGKLIGVAIDRMTKGKPPLKVFEVAIQIVINVEAQLFEQFLPTVEILLDGKQKLITPMVDIEDQPQPESGNDHEADGA